MSFYDFPKHLEELQTKSHERYWNDAGNHMLIGGYNLTPGSVVMDVGGFKGDFTANIVKMYNCQVHVYEPVRSFSKAMEERFKDNPWIKVHNYALEDRDYTAPIAGMDDGSSIFFPCDVDAETVNIHDVAKELEIPIDLLVLNGEGCEYPVLERLIQTCQIRMINNLLVQFHIFVPDAERRRNEIRESLRRTHNEKFNYDFCWEAWTRK